MFKITVSSILFVSVCLFSSLSAFMELPPYTRKDLERQFDRGIENGASYMIWYWDKFSYEEFVHFLHSEEDLHASIKQMYKDDWIGVIRVFDLNYSFNENFSFDRNWWR